MDHRSRRSFTHIFRLLSNEDHASSVAEDRKNIASKILDYVRDEGLDFPLYEMRLTDFELARLGVTRQEIGSEDE